jgi:hypothetical protein
MVKIPNVKFPNFSGKLGESLVRGNGAKVRLSQDRMPT